MSQAALNTRNSEEEVSSRRNNGTRLAGILFLLTVLTTVLVSGWVVLGWMEDAQRLPLSKLVLTGERHYTRNDDIRQSILALGEPGTFMTQDVNIIQTQIEQRLPWIKQVSVRKQWPDELKIHLVEYVPIARWNDQHMVDAEGIAVLSGLICPDCGVEGSTHGRRGRKHLQRAARSHQQAGASNAVWPGRQRQ